MLLVIHNLPNNIKYGDVKALIREKCGLSEVVLDDLLNEGAYMKVTVGLADDGDAALLVRKINGLYIGGQQLYVEDIRKKKASEQPYRSSAMLSTNYQETFPLGISGNGNESYKPLYNPNTQNFAMNMQNQNAAVNQDAMSIMMRYNMQQAYLNTMNAQNDSMLGYSTQQQQMTSPMAISGPSHETSFNQVESQGRRSNWNTNKNLESSWGKTESDSYPTKSRWDIPENTNIRTSNWGAPRQANYDYKDTDSYQREKDYVPSQTYHSGRDGVRQSQYQQDTNNSYSSSQNNSQMSAYNRPFYEQNISEPPAVVDRRSRFDTQPVAYPRLSEIRDDSYAFDNDSPRKSRSLTRPERPPKRPYYGDSNEPMAKICIRSKPVGVKNVPKTESSFVKRRQPPVPNVGKPFISYNRFKEYQKSNYISLNQHKSTSDLDVLLKKSNTWRGQAVSSIAKEIMGSSYCRIPNTFHRARVLTKLKTVLKERIDKLIMNDVKLRTEEIIVKYRNSVPRKNDKYVFSEVIELLKKEERVVAIEADIKPKVESKVKVEGRVKMEGKVKVEVGTGVKPPNPPKPKPVPVLPKIKEAPQCGRVPKHPNSDKKVYRSQKLLQKMEQKEGFYELPEKLQKVLDEESDILCDLFMEPCLEPEKPADKKICEKISDLAADDFRKLVRLMVTKRILGIQTLITVRILPITGPPPRKEPLEQFLRKYNVASLKKSERLKMYTAQLTSFESFDKLCALKQVEIDGKIVAFKPLHIIGPPNKVSRDEIVRERRKMAVACLKPQTDINQYGPNEVQAFDSNEVFYEDVTGDLENPTEKKTEAEEEKPMNIKEETKPDVNDGDNKLVAIKEDEKIAIETNGNDQDKDLNADWNEQWDDGTAQTNENEDHQDNDGDDDQESDDCQVIEKDNVIFDADTVNEDDLEEW